MEHKDFEFEVPEGYKEVFHIDATDKKTGLKLTLGALAIMVVAVALVIENGDSGGATAAPKVCSVLKTVFGEAGQ